MDTSKTRSIKSLLLQAWRERWSDVTWGIRIKSVLPRGVSGDVYDLADCILQQALVGPGPNNLFMSYLMHSLSSRVVSYGAVLSSIGRYQSFYKPYCILSLLDLLKTFQSRIGCHGNEEECIALCKAVVSVTHWLYSCVFHSITKLAELKQSPEHISIMEKSYEALFYFSNSNFIKSLLFVGKFEDQGMYAQMLQKHRELENKITQVTSNTNVTKETIEGALSLVSSVDSLPMVPYERIPKSNERLQILASTLNIMVGIDAILNPASDVTAFVNQLLLVKKLQSFKLSQLYCEIIRACFIGIIDASGSSEDLKWFAFSFLKVPHLISKIHSIQTENEEDALEKGLDILLQYSPLLDLTDLKSNCDCLQYLTNEFCKVGMLTEAQMRKLVTRRQSETFKHSAPKQNQQGGQANATFILRAETTVISILRSLDSDYSRIQDKLLGVLCHMVTGKNFELILSAAAATGKLHTFTAKLIHFNDYNQVVTAETVKASQIRALLFDVTFLLLCHITQYYGIEIVTGIPDKKDSFFVQWASECLAEGGKFKCPELLLSRCDMGSVDALLSQFLNTEQEIKTHQVKWHEVCINAPSAAREILVAWEHGALSTEKVKVILDHIKGQMCFLPVCISAWLCNYINVLHHEERLKPMNMLQQFMAPLLLESTSSPAESPSGSGRQTPQMPGNDQSNLYYTERSTLMVGIINKMLYDLHPPPQAKFKLAPLIPHGLTIRAPLGNILDEVFTGVHFRGWLDLKSIHYFDTLLCVGGARWLCEVLVRRILSYQFSKDINKAVDMVLGIFYLDIEQCALALLLHVLPFYLYSDAHQEQLAEPYGTALSRLTVITTYAALQSRQCSSVTGSKSGCKRSHREVDIDDSRDPSEHSRPSKIHRSNAELLEDTPFELQSLSDDHLRNAVANPINKAIADLMRTLLVIASDATISARSHFPIRFLEQVVLCAKDQASAMLQFMPLGLVGLLLKKFPEEFNHELILAVSSMQSPRARKVAALSLCQLTIAQNRLTSKNQCWLGF
ncbi:mediator of RNA polymerase II transcription subunit 24-like [Stegodyphus dumicola]|uniref:mediator of RNA polymerase II transcription subunit 24-like n=1 Tax=Stegodyphus dumicola TaxID=202533 RepID=UPI0015AE4270|nr:mediator of RNA polymerase II transcription subunit 24-like [Stegodyphus dumicola]XP_035218682.1 mediator of RNA polymerase II transcription subunit 24-like [Stegodyphus dumicola]XP_035218683.1 mediator of RNA polymerase II transcription subunit 24-like [Stegodyphus dumicola]XP_035218685.1 mediator of RNA polymerase II transcription subunit 24-like [Stegodyphus dumicola]